MVVAYFFTIGMRGGNREVNIRGKGMSFYFLPGKDYDRV